MARRSTSITLSITVDEDAARDIEDFGALMESLATHVRRAAIGGLPCTLRSSVVATVGDSGIDYSPPLERPQW